MSTSRRRRPNGGGERRLRAVRGAVTAARDDASSIRDATEELLRELLVRNHLEPADLVSVIFTATPDLTAEFPAAAAHRLGLSEVPLLCAAEIPVQGALDRCIRILMHVAVAPDRPPLKPVYLREAQGLRRDRG